MITMLALKRASARTSECAVRPRFRSPPIATVMPRSVPLARFNV
jgi:hypothetical protein